MPKFTFYGCSDDLFLAAKDGRDVEEIYPPQMYMLQHESDMVVVSAVYGARAEVWSIGVEPFDDDVQIPQWPISVALGGRGYSAELTIDAPDGVELSILNILDD